MKFRADSVSAFGCISIRRHDIRDPEQADTSIPICTMDDQHLPSRILIVLFFTSIRKLTTIEGYRVYHAQILSRRCRHEMNMSMWLSTKSLMHSMERHHYTARFASKTRVLLTLTTRSCEQRHHIHIKKECLIIAGGKTS